MNFTFNNATMGFSIVNILLAAWENNVPQSLLNEVFNCLVGFNILGHVCFPILLTPKEIRIKKELSSIDIS